MAVMLKTQSIMPDIIGGIDGFCHGPDTQLLEYMLFGFTLYVDQHLVERFCNCLWRFGIENMAILFGKVDKRQQLFLVGGIVDAVRKRNGFLVQFDLSHIFGNSLISQEHEFLYQLMRFLTFLDYDADGLAFFIELKPDLGRGEVDRPFLEPALTHALGDFVQGSYFVLVESFFLFDDLLRFFIGEAMVRMNDGPADPILFDLPFVVHLKYGRESELVFMRPERTKFVGNPFGEHGVDPV